MAEANESKWYTRPVIFVEDTEAALAFYCKSLGFKKSWGYDDKGKVIVAQVCRGDICELILCEDKKRAGKSRIFIELHASELSKLRKSLKRKNVDSQDSFWGMPVIEVKDLDGNELLFPTGS